ncbi:MAG TPA: DegQ family serine endoprotease [Bacteroidetes bacterium]|nr:DegQ family serine endoprotease [Bacteroidota bacterium]
MKITNVKQHMWLFVVVGIVIGLVVAAGFNWTHETNASLADHEKTAVKEQNQIPDGNVAQQLSDVFAAVAKKVSPAVVTIFTEKDIKVQQRPYSGSPFDQFFGDDFFKRFFQSPQSQGDMKQMGLGSGVITNDNGTILTNNHVVDGADNIKVRLMDGREFEAKVKGKDPQTDLAVITIEAKNLQAIQLGNSDAARVGNWVLAIGSPLNPQLAHTVTAGIISAKGRSGVGLTHYEDYIQTDAAINPGNSGGALVNMKGKLIGINSAIATQTGGFMGIGFAIPVNLAKKIMGDIIEKGKVVRGWLGVTIQNVTPDLSKAMKLKTVKGVIVSSVQKDAPAEKAGLKEEDVILRFNGKEVHNTTELSTWISSTSPDTKVTLEVIRDGKIKSIDVKLGELNPQTQQLAQGKSTYDKIGMSVANITPDLIQKYRLPDKQKGVVITGVDPSGVAAEIGIREGDVVAKVNRKTVNSLEDFDKIMQDVKSGDSVLFYINRGENHFFVAFPIP